jgi:hypothetical protein
MQTKITKASPSPHLATTGCLRKPGAHCRSPRRFKILIWPDTPVWVYMLVFWNRRLPQLSVIRSESALQHLSRFLKCGFRSIVPPSAADSCS